MPAALWRRLPEKVQRKMLHALRSRLALWITKTQRREIGVLAASLHIPRERLREHLDFLSNRGVRLQQMGDAMVEQLKEMKKLAEATQLNPEVLKKNLRNRPIADIMNEMKEHYQAQQQMQGQGQPEAEAETEGEEAA